MMALGMEVDMRTDAIGGEASICVKNPDPVKRKLKCIQLRFRTHPSLMIAGRIIELLDKGDATVKLNVKCRIYSPTIDEVSKLMAYLNELGIETEFIKSEEKKAEFKIEGVISSAGKTSIDVLTIKIESGVLDEKNFEVKRVVGIERTTLRKKHLVGEGETKVIDGKEYVVINTEKMEPANFLKKVEHIVKELSEYESREKTGLLIKGILDKMRKENPETAKLSENLKKLREKLEKSKLRKK